MILLDLQAMQCELESTDWWGNSTASLLLCL